MDMLEQKKKYGERTVERYGQDVVDRAIELAPKILAFKKKIKAFAKEIENSDEGQMLMAVMSSARGYGGERNTSSNVGDLFMMN